MRTRHSITAAPRSSTGAVYKAIPDKTLLSFIKHALINHTLFCDVKGWGGFVHRMKKREEEKEGEGGRERGGN